MALCPEPLPAGTFARRFLVHGMRAREGLAASAPMQAFALAQMQAAARPRRVPTR